MSDGEPLLPADAGPASSVGVLLIRVWTEPAEPDLIRARVLSVTEDGQQRSWTTKAGDGAVLDAVRSWLSSRRRQHSPGQP